MAMGFARIAALLELELEALADGESSGGWSGRGKSLEASSTF
jgi:hypothetical protein